MTDIWCWLRRSICCWTFVKMNSLKITLFFDLKYKWIFNLCSSGFGRDSSWGWCWKVEDWRWSEDDLNNEGHLLNINDYPDPDLFNGRGGWGHAKELDREILMMKLSLTWPPLPLTSSWSSVTAAASSFSCASTLYSLLSFPTIIILVKIYILLIWPTF